MGSFWSAGLLHPFNVGKQDHFLFHQVGGQFLR